MKQSLVKAINAIELADDDANVKGLRAYCAECGLTDEQLQELIDTPGPTDLGRVTRAIERGVEKAPAPAKKKTKKKKAKKKTAK